MVALETVQQPVPGRRRLPGLLRRDCGGDRPAGGGAGRSASTKRLAEILTENREKLDELARYLYEKETITGDEFMEILNQ